MLTSVAHCGSPARRPATRLSLLAWPILSGPSRPQPSRRGHRRNRVEVDRPGDGDQAGDALDALVQHVVSHQDELVPSSRSARARHISHFANTQVSAEILPPDMRQNGAPCGPFYVYPSATSPHRQLSTRANHRRAILSLRGRTDLLQDAQRTSSHLPRHFLLPLLLQGRTETLCLACLRRRILVCR